MNNIVFVNFECNESTKVVAQKIWQYDYGQILRIQGLNLPAAVEIHFSLQKTGGAAKRRIGVTRDGVTDVVIPDFILTGEGIERNYSAYAFIYLSDEESGQTEHRIELNITSRPEPEGSSKEEDTSFGAIMDAVNEIAKQSSQGVSDEQIAEAVEKYMEENQVEGNVTVDTELSETSTNPVQNKVVTAKFSQLSDTIDDLKGDLNDLKENGIGGGRITASEALKNILQRIQTEIKACIRDDSVCPNSYIDETDNLINNIGTGSGEGGGTDEPVDPNPPIEEPDNPVVPDTGWTYDPSKWVSGWTLDNYGQKPVANNATYARVYGYDTDDYYIPIPEGSTKVIFSTTSGVNFNGQMYEFEEDKSYYQRGSSTGKQEHTFVFKGGATSKYIALGINYASETVPNESLQITFE